MTVHIISRAEWGAVHPDGFGPAPVPFAGIYLHHSATVAPDLVAPFDDDDDAVRTLERIGQSRFGGGISYTWAVTPVGRLYQGHSVDRQGAHTRGLNSTHRAVVLVGNYETSSPTEAQLDAVAGLLRHCRAQGWITAARLAGGHRDAPAASTACPGINAYNAITEINRRASAPAPVPTPRPTVPSSAVQSGVFPVLRYGQRSEQIRTLQRFMTRVFRSYNAYQPSGFYGDNTRDGIREFQRRTGITGPDANGEIVGPRTNLALAAYGYRP